MTEEQKKLVIKFQKDNNVKVKKNKETGYYDFYCACGEKKPMWNNIFGGKKSAKSPDLRCASKNCEYGKGEFSNGVWVKDEIRNALGIKKRAGDSKKSGSQSSGKSSGAYSGDRYGNDIQISMYAKWAHEQALYLAKETGVKAHDELDLLFRSCLQNMGGTLDWYKAKVENKKAPEDQKVKDLDDTDDLDLDDSSVGDPEDVNEDSLDDLDDEDTEEKAVEDDGFEGLDDVDL